MVKGIIFDCYGVLVGRGFEATYRSAGGDPLRDRLFIEDILGQSNLGLINDKEFNDRFSRQLGISSSAWEAAIAAAEHPDIELLAYIETLHKKFKTAILTNSHSGTVSQKLGKDLIRQCFDAVIVSGDLGFAKPDPRIYTHAAEKLSVAASECIFIDDRPDYVQGAEVVGMSGILYGGFELLKSELNQLLKN